MSQHTPGPWKISDGSDICIVTTDVLIAAVTSDEDYPQNRETMTANARLIAAAPEMLELLERYVKRGDDLSAEYREARALLARLQPDTERKG